MSRKIIGVSSYGIGYDLTGFFDVEFRQLSRGFSVWSCDSESEDPEKPSGLKKVGSSNKPLNWRSVCEFLFKNQDLHVGGFWDSVNVSGVEPWAKDFVKCAFVRDEDLSDYREPIVELLMGFEDDEVREVLDQLGGSFLKPVNEVVFEDLRAIEEAAREMDFVGKPLSSILESVGLAGGAALETIVARMEVLESDEHIRHLFDLSQSGADRPELNEQWSKVINDCDRDMCTTLLLVDLWLSSTPKPFCTSGHLEGEWAVVRWLLGGQKHILELFSALKKSNPKQAEEFGREVMRMGKAVARYCFEQPYRFVGGAMAPLGRHIEQTKVNIALDCQAVLDQLGIRFDPEYRIGDMPYFKSANPSKS